MATSLSTSGPPSNTRFLRPIQAHIPKWHFDRFSHFCTDDYSVAILYNGTPLSPSKLPIPVGDPDPHLIHGSLGLFNSSHVISHIFAKLKHRTCISVTTADTAMENVPLLTTFTSRLNSSSVVRSTQKKTAASASHMSLQCSVMDISHSVTNCERCG